MKKEYRVKPGHNFFILVGLVLLFFFSPQIQIHSQIGNNESENSKTKLTADAELTEKVYLEFLRAFVIYYKNQGSRSREEANLTWEKIAQMGVRPQSTGLNYLILLSALNTGRFEEARKALLALNVLESASENFQIDGLETLAIGKPENELAVSIAESIAEEFGLNLGSGTIISNDGWILTAAHVLAVATNPVVIFPDGKKSEIETVIVGNFENDMVLVKVDKSWNSHATLAISSLQKGDIIYSVGFPMGCNVPVKSKGVILESRMDNGYTSIGSTLSCLPGSSGSGVFNQKGELVGIVKALPVVGNHDQTSPRKAGASLTPLSDIQKLFQARQNSKPSPLSEKRKWAEKSEFWSLTISGTELYQKAMITIMSDRTRGQKMLEEAYKQGHMGAATQLGILLNNKENPSNEDRNLCYKYFFEASKTVPLALANLGCLKIYGNGVGKDVAGGINDLKEAFNRGAVEAALMLGQSYLQGLDGKKDENESFKWMLKAAELGEPRAQAYLGNFFQEGIGVEKDEKKAFEWFKKSAEQGDPEGQSFLSYCYWRGKGVSMDAQEGFKWSYKAAEQGIPDAQAMVGMAYYEGCGVEKDLNKAVYFLEKAKKNGDKTSTATLIAAKAELESTKK